MGNVIMISGPIGAGKTTVCSELATLWSGPLVAIEGDAFWPFINVRKDGDRREDFRLLMRSMTAASVPFARSGYDVLLDFSIPPAFLKTARAILREVELDYVVLKPSLAVCAARARSRETGQVTTYDRGFYDLFEGAGRHTIAEDDDPPALARRIQAALGAGAVRVEAVPTGPTAT